MKVDEALVSRLAQLAKLRLTDDRVHNLCADLTGILQMVEKLNELELDGVAPLSYVTDAEQVLRPDRVGDHLDRAAAMANAPDGDGTFFRVPRVL